MKTIECEMCGKIMATRGGAKKYCNHCRQKRDLELRELYKEKLRQKKLKNK